MKERVHETFDEILYEVEEEGSTNDSMRYEQSRSASVPRSCCRCA